jgi:hypothetical protein
MSVVTVGFIYLFMSLGSYKSCGGGDTRRWMTHFNLFWNKQADHFRKNDFNICSLPPPESLP